MALLNFTQSLLDDWRDRVALVPLLAAIIAPLSSLLDIPALTEPWFVQNGDRLSDPHVNLVLSAVSLFVNFVANALLLLRFSVGNEWWKWAMRSSLVCWIVKLVIATSNILVFGVLTRNSPGISYAEGFWCTVVSIFINLVIVALLIFHYYFVFKNRRALKDTDQTEVQVGITGRHFMLQQTLFIATIAVLALFMSRLEDWSYLQGIYFSVVTFLTIGFGDFSPTRASTQIVLFPFAVAGIIQLALLIEMIVSFLASHEHTRHARWRAQYEKARQEDKDKNEEAGADLVEEMVFLRDLYESSYKIKVMRDLALNVTGFVLFWVLGALIFSQIENWTYGQGMYFGYVFFLSIGYGDYAPTTPAGRVIFVLYSIIAVPVMTTFAVQTIQSILRRISLTRLRHRREEFGLEAELEDEDTDEEEQVGRVGESQRQLRQVENGNGNGNGNGVDARRVKVNGAAMNGANGEAMIATNVDVEAGRDDQDDHHEDARSDASSESSVEHPSEIRERFTRRLGKWKASHAEYVSMGHDRIRKILHANPINRTNSNVTHFSNPINSTNPISPISPTQSHSANLAIEQLEHEDRILTEHILEQAVELERRARRLLLASLAEGENCHTLLKADRIVQLRSIKKLREQEKGCGIGPPGEGGGGGGQDQDGELSSARGSGSGSSGRQPLPHTLHKPFHKCPSINDKMNEYYEEEAQLSFSCALGENEMLVEICRYREAFAGLLAAGSRLLKLKDEERYLFERRLRELEGGGEGGGERERERETRSLGEGMRGVSVEGTR